MGTQLALGSVPVYLVFWLADDNNHNNHSSSIGQGWSWLAGSVAVLGAAGGLLVALSIQYGDAILKTLATTGSIILAALLDHLWMDGPLTPAMCIAAVNVILAIGNYTFDATTPPALPPTTPTTLIPPLLNSASHHSTDPSDDVETGNSKEERVALLLEKES